MDSKTIELIIRAWKEKEDFVGRDFLISDSFKDIIDKNNNLVQNIGQYISQYDDDNKPIEVYIKSNEYERYTLLYVIMKMIEDGEIQLSFTDNATDKNKNYIKKLVESCLKLE